MSFARAGVALVAGALALTGCDYPTTAPILTQRWVLPAENTTIGVDQFLPPGVEENGDAFTLAVDPATVSESLGALCSACPNGVTVPKPSFTGTLSTSASFPANVSGATLISGSVALAVHNGFSFDPIRPGAGNTGSLTITLTDGPAGPQVAQVVIDGATEALPPGSTVNKLVALTPGPVGPTVYASSVLVSPAGDPVALNTSESLTITATPQALLMSSAEVAVAGRTVRFDSTSLDVSDIDQSIIDAVDQGAYVFDLTNPFGVSVDGNLEITGDGVPTITKTLSVPDGATSSTTVTFTGEELRSFLGRSNVQLTGSGVVSAAGPITVEPAQEITIDGKLDLSLSFGG